MTHLEDLHLAALLHDIGKFRMRHTQPNKRHQEHSYEFVSQEFFSPCGTAFTDAIRHHHPERYPGCPPSQLQHLIEKQVILADRLSASEREDEEREREYFGKSALVSPMSRLTGSTNEHRYPLTALTLDRNTIIPEASVEVNQEAYTTLWQDFIEAFSRLTENATYTPAAHYQTIVALLRKYTARMPSSTPWGQRKERSVPDISLYDHLRTTAAIAACIGRELTEVEEVEAQLGSRKDPERKICALIKGDISGIQNFLYQIPSDGAARQLRGRSFYIQLLTEVIAHYVLRRFELPITNLILSSGGHFYILAPYTETQTKLDALRQSISEKLWTLHKGDIACLLASTPITADDFAPTHFPDKWRDVSIAAQPRKQRKWSELGHQAMFENLFEPSEKKTEDWKFDALGQKLPNAAFLITFEIPEQPIPETPDWKSTLRAFGSEVHICPQTDATPPTPTAPPGTERVTVYSLGDGDFLKDTAKFQWQGLPVSYDFIARPPDGRVADYDALANASKGAKWLGALRMDVDDLGKVFSKEKLENATLSRLATLSDALRLFFEGYVPELCRAYNAKQPKDILELIYAGGDDLFLVGGWSALPEIAKKLRSEFRDFVTGNHVTLSGGIAIEHKKYPLYQFAEQSGEAEKDAKHLSRLNAEGKRVKKNAISFLRTPMSWEDFDYVSKWHQTFLGALTTDRSLPHGMLTRLNQIYSPQELEGKRWAWRSLYYFSRLEDRYRAHHDFIEDLRRELNQASPACLRKFIGVVTRWTALKIRETQ